MVRRWVWVGFVVLCMAVASNAPAARGQAVYGSVIGTVTDPQGGAVVGAKVTVTSTAKGTADTTTTNESGNYSVTHLIPDAYRIRIEAAGFKATEIANVQVSADTSARVDTSLQVGEVTQSVEVTSEVPQLKTDRADVSITFNEKYASELPILNRNFTSFELLAPGTQKLVGWSHAATENPQGGQQIFVNGQHFSGTAFELDGTDNQDPILGIIVVNPNLDAIQEAKMTLQNYDAEFGKAVAGIVTVQTKSGTNQFHGSGFLDWRGDGQQARDPFTNAPGVPLPHASFKQFGGGVGGPVFKDKLFFFGDYQGTRQTNGITNQVTIPTALVQSTCNPATNTTGFCDLSEYLGKINGGGQVFDPATGDPLTGSGRTAFAGNLIPIGRISPEAAAVLAAYPAPTSGGLSNNFVGSGSGPYDQNSMDVRIDYNAPREFRVFGRFSLDYFSLSGKGTLGDLGGVGFGPGGLNGTSIVHNYSLATGFDKALGSTLLTDVRFGYLKYNPVTAYSDAGTTPMTGFGIPGLNLGTPNTTGLSSFFFGGNGMTNGSNSGFGDGLNVGRCNCPLTESEQQFQVANNWTKIKGNHQIKFGADIRYAMNLRVPSDSNRTGQLNFNSGDTAQAGQGGLDLATFLLGDVTSFQRFVSTSLTAAERQKRWFFYGQDTWRVNSKLSINYGLRWEIYFPENVNGKGQGGFASLDDLAIHVAGYGNNSLNGNTSNSFKNLAPRLGIAYQWNPKTVIRMGYGRSFDIGVFGTVFGHVVTQNLPVLANQDVSDSSVNAGATNDRSAVFTLATGPQQLTPITIPSDGILPFRGPGNNVDPRVRPDKIRLPTLDAWNATIQRQVTPTLNVEVAYIGNKGTHVFAGTGPAYNTNEAAVGAGINPLACTAATGGGFDCAPTSFQADVSQASRRRLFGRGIAVDVGNYFGDDASSSYNALQVKAEKRFASGLQFLTHYTFAHANNHDGSYFSVDPSVSYGPDPFTRTHVFVISTVYELPFGRGKRFLGGVGRAGNFVVGGWQISHTLNWSGGLPWTPTIGECGNISDAGPCRPDKGSGSFKLGKTTAANGDIYWFTPVAPLAYPASSATDLTGTDSCTLARPTSGPFVLPACGSVGNAGLNSYRGPHALFSDMSLAKSFNFSEKVKAQFRFDAYNVFNHPVLGFNSNQGNLCIDCTGRDPGRIQDIEADSTPNAPNGMRQLQFGLRFSF
jgi:Carboxypeptidase regulatory-like domain/TonB dependent receptor